VRGVLALWSLVASACCSVPLRDDVADAEKGGMRSSEGVLISRCVEDASSLHCAHHTRGYEVRGSQRCVLWQVPVGEPPATGWPLVFLFQGSSFPPSTFWDVSAGMPFGGWYQGQVVRTLLDHGYAVLTPSTSRCGHSYWDTNDWRFAKHWEASDDHLLLSRIFDDVERGALAPFDTKRLYAAGISSGGYMTSRMAVAYPGRFRALAIQSASYATCGGPFCRLPSSLPADHPPTLFLHGRRDFIVPIGTMRAYKSRLEAQGTPIREIEDARVGHEWLAVAPMAIEAWFTAH
jgi:poly(3-hydroxybutyrate) depolymerase